MSSKLCLSELSDLISSTCYSLPDCKSSVKLYCLSDLHADSAGCLEWLKNNCICRDDESIYTVFICAGDVSADVAVLREVFLHLKANYNEVCFTPGNHDLWRKGSEKLGQFKTDNNARKLAHCSFSKLHEVLQCADDCQVRTGPLRLLRPPSEAEAVTYLPSSIVIAPLFSWYHSSWDNENDLEHPDFMHAEQLLPFDKKWSDFRMCAWSSSYLFPEKTSQDLIQPSTISSTSTDLAQFFARMNDPFLATANKKSRISDSDSPDQKDEVVVTYSHFLPRQELCPEKIFLLEPHMTKVIGSNYLEQQIRQIEPQLHIFGHTHIPMEIELDGIRYVQWPLGYAREKEKGTQDVYREGPLMVYDSTIGNSNQARGFPSRTPCSDSTWSQYYRENSRHAENQELSPWLAAKLTDFLEGMGIR